MKDTIQDELTIAREAVARLETEAQTIPFTKTDKATIQQTKIETRTTRLVGEAGKRLLNSSEIKWLAKYVDLPFAFNVLLDGHFNLQSRLEALEADSCPRADRFRALEERLDGLIPDNIRNDGWTTVGFHDGKPVRYKVGVEAPATVEETVAAETIKVGDILADLTAMTRATTEAAEAAFAAKVAQSVRDGLKDGLPLDDLVAKHKAARQSGETISDDDKLHIEKLRSTIAMLDKRHKEMLANIQGWADKSAEQEAEIAKLKHERTVAADDTTYDRNFVRWLKYVEASREVK